MKNDLENERNHAIESDARGKLQFFLITQKNAMFEIIFFLKRSRSRSKDKRTKKKAKDKDQDRDGERDRGRYRRSRSRSKKSSRRDRSRYFFHLFNRFSLQTFAF